MNQTRTKWFPRTLAVTFSLAALTVTAACGGASSGTAGDTSAAAPSSSAPSSSAAPAGEANPFGVTKDDALAALLPASVRDAGVLKVASEVYPPAVIVEKPGAEPTGWDIETTRAVAAALGLKAEFEIVPFDSILPGLQGNRYQAAAGEIYITDERTKVVTFVKNHESTDGLLVKAGSSVNGKPQENLCGLTVSAQLGSQEVKLAQEIAAKCKAAGKDLKILTFKEQAAVNLAVQEGRSDAAIGTVSQVAYVVDQSGGKLAIAELDGAPTFGVGLLLARNSDTDALAKAVEAATNKLLKDGTIQKILDKYNGGLGIVPAAEIVPAA